MRYYCSYSGLPLEINYFPISLDISSSTRYHLIHPIFTQPQSSLLSALNKFESSSLDASSTKLLFLAFLNSTTLIEWRCPADISLNIATKHMHSLAEIAIDILTIPNLKEAFPSFIIDSDSCHLPRIKEWIAIWNECKSELSEGLRSYYRRKDYIDKERALASILRSSSRDTSNYTNRLANWVMDAAQFPITPILIDTGERVSCAIYWRDIIKAAGNPKTNILTINKGDILDILDHLEDNLELGTVFADAIWQLLETTIDKLDNFLGIDLDNPFQLVTESSRPLSQELIDIENNSAKAIASITADVNISDGIPQLSNYTNKIEYLKAMAKYRLALSSSTISNTNNTSQDTI